MPIAASWPWQRCAAVLVGAAAAFSAMPSRAGGDPVPAPQARQWLQRVQLAAAQRNYQGTLVVTGAGAISSSRITHYCEGVQSYERVDMLDGQPRRVLRKNDQTLTLWPAAKVARIEQREPIQPFPALLKGSEDQLLDRYELLAEGPGRLAGHEAAVFLLRPRDGHRFAQRLWSELGTGLLLRADVLAADGRVLETSAFSELTIGAKAKPESVSAALKQLEGWRVLKPVHQRTELEAEGWQLKVPLPGFQLKSCIKRQLETSAGTSQSPAMPDVVQAVFTDGLTHVSLFIEPLQVDRHRPGSATTGATHTWMQPVGSTHWVTVMGDVPMATLKQFAQALERRR
jgi:sigma-E factor negative regulatory protein RseB